jgi:hypothetical protein
MRQKHFKNTNFYYAKAKKIKASDTIADFSKRHDLSLTNNPNNYFNICLLQTISKIQIHPNNLRSNKKELLGIKLLEISFIELLHTCNDPKKSASHICAITPKRLVNLELYYNPL